MCVNYLASFSPKVLDTAKLWRDLTCEKKSVIDKEQSLFNKKNDY